MTSEQPSYLKLLQAIAKGEGGAEKFLLKWADTTKDPAVASTLRFVAMREGEHAYIFRKRVMELTGEDVAIPEGDAKTLAIAGDTSMSDREKFEKLKLTKPPAPDQPDPFSKMFDNKDIDPVTGGLLGRYIAEERDSGRHFADCYKALCERDPKPAEQGAADGGLGAAALVTELERLSKLRADGVLTMEEFNAAKTQMLKLGAVSKM